MVSMVAMAATLCGMLALGDTHRDTAQELLALERQAMDGWQEGDPDAALAVSDDEITLFHVIMDKRVDGLPAVKALWEQYRGKPLFDSYEIADPKVQAVGEVAVLTYQLVTRNGSTTRRYNGTQVYQRKKEVWRVIHTHWSVSRPSLPAPQQP
jgi:hypothetical protein